MTCSPYDAGTWSFGAYLLNENYPQINFYQKDTYMQKNLINDLPGVHDSIGV
jgi:hypothetical protein